MAAAAERSRILDAAYRCLHRDGAPVSVTAILAEAGLSTRAFYRHFDSKDTLVLAMLRQDTERVHAALTEAATTAPTAAEALRRWIEGFLSLATDPAERPHVLVMASEELPHTLGYAAERARLTNAHRSALSAILTRGRADGTLPRADPPADARVIASALLDTFHGLLCDPSDPPAATGPLLGFTFRALGAA